jgi:signal peptidase I
MSTEDDAHIPGEGHEPVQDAAPAAEVAAEPAAEAPVEHFQAEPAQAEIATEEPALEDVAEPVVPEAPAMAVPAPQAAAVAGAEAVHEADDEHDEDEEEQDTVGGRAKSEAVEIGKTIFFALLIAFVLRVVLFQPFTIPSASMEPNLYQGDYIIVTKWSYGYSHFSIPFSPPIFKGRLFNHAPTRGDIVVFRLPREPKVDYIKRVIGLPGDKIQMRDNQLYINGVATVDVPKGPAVADDAPPSAIKLQETLPNKKTFMTQDFGPNQEADNTAVYTVPAGCYFMMGDNRDNSVDSRFDPQIPAYGDVHNSCGWDASTDAALGMGAREAGVGFVPAENLIGKAQIIMFSWYPGASLFNPISWFSKVRFSRFLHPLH